jgi:hypothetical protein
VNIGSRDDLVDVWGTADDDVWIASAIGEIYRFDGTSWRYYGGAPLYAHALWCAPDSPLLVVGADGASIIGHSDHFAFYPTRTPAGVAGLGPTGDRLLAVGANGELSRFNGASWNQWINGVYADLAAVWGAHEDDAWAVGGDGTLLHFDGDLWADVAGVTESDLNAIWGSAADDVWAVGDDGAMLHYNGAEWIPWQQIDGANLLDVWGTSAGNVWIAGASGTLLHYDGLKWSEQPDPYADDSGYSGSWQSVFGGDADEIWFAGTWQYSSDWGGAGGPALTRWREDRWDSYGVDEWVVKSAWSLAKNNIWAVTDSRIVHWNGAEWAPQYTGGAAVFNAVSVLEDQAVIVIDEEGTIFRRSM